MKVKLLTIWLLTGLLVLSPGRSARAQCMAPNNVGATWSCSSAVVFWPIVPTAQLYEYKLMSSSIVGQGQTTSNSTFFPTLSPSTIYMASVRTICGPNDTSAWSAPYTFVTQACNNCVMPAWLTVSPVSCDSLFFTWDVPASTNGFEWTVTSSPGTPTAGWNFRTVPYASIGGLTGSTVYYVHVRNSCGGNNYSAVKTVVITTPPCPPPCPKLANITTSTTPHSITASWTATGSAQEYEYVVDNNAGAPTTAGTTVTNNTVTVSNLAAATDYYFHVRCNCGPGNNSEWSEAQQVKTQQATGIGQVAAGHAEVFPNPAGAQITVRLTRVSAQTTLTLATIDGRVVKTLHPQTENIQIDISSLTSGVYLLRYQDAESTEILKVNKL